MQDLLPCSWGCVLFVYRQESGRGAAGDYGESSVKVLVGLVHATSFVKVFVPFSSLEQTITCQGDHRSGTKSQPNNLPAKEICGKSSVRSGGVFSRFAVVAIG
jgi:hypothetical protein